MGKKHSLVMKRERWHTQSYNLWLRLGGEAPAYKENLCRYFWIVLVRSPLRWFFLGRVKKVPPFMVAAVPLTFSGLVLVVLNWPGFSVQAAEVLGVLVGICLAGVGVLMALLEAHDRWPKGFKKTFKIVGFPVWILPYLIDRTAKSIWRRIGGAVETVIGAYIYGIKWSWLNPFGATVIAGIAAASYYAPNFVVGALALIGIFLGCVVVAVLIIAACVFSKKAFGEEVRDTVNLAREYVSNKKQGSLICPFIEFE